ncbi:MAG: nicotinamide mononucleotide transporter [Lachnospiraceae bacterium]|nr:nicotinamide mononucleotide transporter [Lachnospiraceae bacterium]
MRGLKQYLKSEITGWKRWEVAWLMFATAVILGLSLYWGEGIIGLVAALTGVWCVILTGKGKRSSFLFGLVNAALYAVIAFSAKYYGEVMLNVLYYLPMGVVGWFAWKKHMNDDTGEVVKKCLPLKKGIVVYAITGVAIFLYGLLLAKLGGKLPYVDSMSTVVSVVAQVLSIWRLTEQWVLWIIVDVVTVIMWGVDFANGGESIATLAMWSIYLVNAIIMFVRWYREASRNSAKAAEQVGEAAEG